MMRVTGIIEVMTQSDMKKRYMKRDAYPVGARSVTRIRYQYTMMETCSTCMSAQPQTRPTFHPVLEQRLVGAAVFFAYMRAISQLLLSGGDSQSWRPVCDGYTISFGLQTPAA
jgi:hypothetical protein